MDESTYGSRAGHARAMAEQDVRGRLKQEPDGGRWEPHPDSPAGRAAVQLYDRLVEGRTAVDPDDIVRVGWTEVFDAALAESPLLIEHRDSEVIRRLLTRTTEKLVKQIRDHTVLDRARIEHLLVDPLTQAVREVGNDSAVFSIEAELIEEGFYLRQVQEPGSETVHTVVDFE